jgi:hypothetical protein
MKASGLVAIILWLGCSYLTYGFTLGAFTHEFPDQYHTSFAVAFSIAGPLGLFADGVLDGFRHWRTVPLTMEERWKIFHDMYPMLSREYFDRRD